MRRLVLLLATTGLVSACAAVGPNYTPPKATTPASFGELPASAEAAPISQAIADPAELSAWWTQFNDAELNRLVGLAMAGNLDLQTAASRIREARQQTVIAGARGLPSVGANGTAVRLDSYAPKSSQGSTTSTTTTASAASGQSPAAAGFTLPSSLEVFAAGFDATWEADIFGGVRRAVQAARANTEAMEWARRDGEVSLSAEVANDYLTYRALQQQIGVLNADLQSQLDTLKIVQSRFKAGVVTELDVNQQNTQLAAARAAIPQLQAQARAQVHALGVLVGQPPETLSDELAAAAPAPTVPKTLPVGLPSDLLRRRPDVREAERQLAAATANVGVAVADLYPKFDLIGAANIQSNSLENLVEHPSLTTVFAGVIQWPIFQGGRIRANIAANEERRTQAYLAYQKAVLGAVRDVEDALARYAAEQQRNLALQQSATAAQRSFGIAGDQYKHGLTNYISVLTSQQSMLQIQDQLAGSNGQLTQDLASLYKALGGGWTNEPVKG